MNLIDKHDRSKLGEGRNSGLGFAFCRKIEDGYEAIMPLTACRDYLNDVVWSEATGKPCTIYGFTSSRQGIFSDGAAYMALGILPVNRTTTKLSNHDQLELALMNPERGLGPFLRYFEKEIGAPPTIFEKVAENRMVASLGVWWVQATYRISLWSLLVRIGLKYEKGDPMKFLSGVADLDAYMAKAVGPKLERMIKEGAPEQNMNEITAPHNLGIYSFNLPIK